MTQTWVRELKTNHLDEFIHFVCSHLLSTFFWWGGGSVCVSDRDRKMGGWLERAKKGE